MTMALTIVLQRNAFRASAPKARRMDSGISSTPARNIKNIQAGQPRQQRIVHGLADSPNALPELLERGEYWHWQ